MTLLLEDGRGQATLYSSCGGMGYGTIDVGWLFTLLKPYSVRVDINPVCKKINYYGSYGGFTGYTQVNCGSTGGSCHITEGENLTVVAFHNWYMGGFVWGDMVSARYDASWTVGYKAKSKFGINAGIDADGRSGSFDLSWQYEYESSDSGTNYFYCMVPLSQGSMLW